MNTTEPEFVGLQLYINQRAAAMVIHAMEPVNITEAQPPLDPPELMVSCDVIAARPAVADGKSPPSRADGKSPPS